MKSEKNTLDEGKCKDAGLALVLITLLCYQGWKNQHILLLTILFLLVTMTYPLVFRPFANIWFALSTAIGTVVSKIILTMLFFALVLPVGRLRRIGGKDAMHFREWKKDKGSVFRIREHRFSAEDLEHPY